MTARHQLDMARIWFSHAFGHRSAAQKRKCETLGWYYLMQAVMKDLHP